MEISLLMIVAVVCAYFVKGICGFANTIIFTSILSFQNNNINITPVDLLIGMPANVLVAYRERESVYLRQWAPLAALVLVGSIPGMLFLKFGNVVLIKIILGITIVVIGVEMLFREMQSKKQPLPKWMLLVIGIISGFISGIFGISALIVAYLGRTTKDSKAFRGNLCMVFLADNIFRFGMYIYLKILTMDVVITVCKLMPFMLLGLGIGMFTGKYLDEKKVKLFVIAMLIVSGLSLIAVNL